MTPIMKSLAFAALLAALPLSASADEIKVLTAGAFKSILVALQPDFERRSGHTLAIANGTAGELAKRIAGGEAFDVVIAPPAAVDDLVASGKVVRGSREAVARVGIGAMVREGAAKPDIASVAAFKQALLDAKSVAYIDPASGGSSGVYLVGLFKTLGVADAVAAKAKLKNGGYVGDLVASGEATFGLHQISEILPVKGVTLVGPIPAEVQSYTTYAAGLGSGARNTDAARSLLGALTSADTRKILLAKGMEPPAP
jgi:molybdate transport system substrate-binding protein